MPTLLVHMGCYTRLSDSGLGLLYDQKHVVTCFSLTYNERISIGNGLVSGIRGGGRTFAPPPPSPFNLYTGTKRGSKVTKF